MRIVQISLGSESGGRIAVVFDGPEASRMAVQQAVALAQQRRGRLTVLAIAPKPWFTIGMAGICPLRLEREMMEHAEQAARQAVSALPSDVPCTTVVRCGARRREADRYLREHDHDVLIMALPKVRRTSWALSLRPVANPA
jgi:nucleotide-binding universal stress UspA family protein